MLSSFSSMAKVNTAPCTKKADIMPFDSQRMKARREELGLTQKELAEKVGVPYQRIQDHEYGTSEPKADRLGRMAEALDCSADYLLGLTDYPAKYNPEIDPEALAFAIRFMKLGEQKRGAVIGIIDSLEKLG